MSKGNKIAEHLMNSGEAWPKTVAEQEKLAQELGCSARMVRHVMKALRSEERKKDEESNRDLLTLENVRLKNVVSGLRSELKRAQKERLCTEDVREFILGVSEATAKGCQPWVYQVPESRSGLENHILSLAIGDLHWGEVVRPEQVMGINSYNLSIASDRLDSTFGNAIWLAYHHYAPRPWDGVVLNLLGDMLTGDIHEELTESNEEHIMPTFVDLFEKMAPKIVTLADAFGKVFVPCVYGNHSRTNKKKQHKNAAYKNFDWLLYHMLARYLAHDDRIQFLIGDDDEIQYQVYNRVYRVTHGDQFKGGQGFVGALAPIIRGEHKKRIASQSYGANYDALIMGHWHQCIWRPRVVVNGSLKGYDEFAMDLNFEAEPPKQMMWLNSPTYGKVSPLEIFCDKGQVTADRPERPWFA